jgi:hypothetical protein
VCVRESERAKVCVCVCERERERERERASDRDNLSLVCEREISAREEARGRLRMRREQGRHVRRELGRHVSRGRQVKQASLGKTPLRWQQHELR